MRQVAASHGTEALNARGSAARMSGTARICELVSPRASLARSGRQKLPFAAATEENRGFCAHIEERLANSHSGIVPCVCFSLCCACVRARPGAAEPGGEKRT